MPANLETETVGPASVGRPGSWSAQRSRGRDGAQILTSKAPAPAGGGTPAIDLRVLENAGDFDAVVQTRRSIRSTSGEGRTESREDIDVPGAQQAVLYRGEVTIGGVRYESADLTALTEDGTTVILNAEVAASGDVDVDELVRSLSLD